MKLKKIMTYDKDQKKVRLFRLIFNGEKYSSFFSISIVPALFRFKYSKSEYFRLVLIGISFHYKRSYGGFYV